MKIEIVTTGDEIMAGELVDTNSAWLAAELFNDGIAVTRFVSVPDDLALLKGELERLAGDADVAVVTGGLGPTEDDITVEVAAEFFGVDVDEHGPSLERARSLFAARGIEFTDNNRKQASYPAGCRVLLNPVGLAPGFSGVKGRCTFYFLPGVPREFKALCRQDIIPELLERDPQQEHFDYRIMKLVAVPESHLARGAGPIMRAFPEVRFGYRAHYPEVWFKFRTTASTQDEASACADEIEAAIRDEFGSKVFGMADDTLQGAVGSLLKSGGLKLSTAESCTGGMVGDLLTSVPGSSDYYLGGAVTYSNEMKKAVLGVPEETLSVYGAVSEECARAMATGARQRFGADLAVAVTGIAGPGGGTPDKPVGTVHLALATPTGIVHKRREFRPGRDMVRTAAASTALNLIRLYLLGVT